MHRHHLVAMMVGASLALGVLAACAGAGSGDAALAGSQPCGGVRGAPPANGCGLVCRASVPLDSSSGRPIATVWIDGLPATMLVDTGAGLSSLSPLAARRLGLTHAVPLARPVLGFSGSQRATAVVAPLLAFGQVTLRDSSLAVLSTPKESLATEPDGTLGVDALANFEIDLDLPHGRMTLYQGTPCPGPLPGWTEEDSAVPFTAAFRRGRQVAIPISIQGHRLTAVVDSGADDTVVDAGVARQLGVSPDELASDLGAAGAGSGPRVVQGLRHRFTDIRIGAEALPSLEATVFDMGAFGARIFLGEDYLQTHKVWISYATGQVHIAHRW